MKKIYISAKLCLIGIAAIAQGTFFSPTTYRGAFAPAPTPMWTDGWTQWDPQNAVYPAPNVTISGNITTNTTWTANNTYLLQGQIYVKNGATLTIEPGTVIRGDYSSVGAGLFITTGSRIMAIGTISKPIVFTSSQAVGSRNIGDWGGVVLLGLAKTNAAGGIANIEGLTPGADTQYGGATSPDDNDNSGTLNYVRIEFGGYVYQPSKEINGLTFGAVGRGTTIDNVQVSFANDDGFEWFGGTVNCKHLVSYRNLDDDFDTDNGFSGNIQFGLSVRDPQIADDPLVSTSEGFESDNDAAGSSNAPLTSALFSNMTLIGPYRGNTGSTIAAGYRRGARIRRNSNLKIFNSVFLDHTRGIHIDGTACETNATSGGLKFKYNIVAGNSTGKVCEVNSASTFAIRSWFSNNNNDSLVQSTGILTTPYNFTAPDYRPASASPALAGADFTDAAFAGLTAVIALNPDYSNGPVNLYPNPVQNSTTLSFELNKSTEVSITIFNLTGQLAAAVKSTELISKGIQQIPLNTESLDAGIYFVKISCAEFTKAVKMIVKR
ncbi:MAG: T9SS type A sorting domain-containing protein [Bacteroidia bacterium]|nr:T9SS type A sorting domain-containing protein [Bacteroidia bacterium]